MLHDPKKTAMLIIAKGKDKEHKNMSKHENDSDEGLNTASEEIISAIHEKDAEALKEALKNFMDICEEKENEEGDESEY